MRDRELKLRLILNKHNNQISATLRRKDLITEKDKLRLARWLKIKEWELE